MLIMNGSEEQTTVHFEQEDFIFNVVTAVLTLITNTCLLGIEVKLWLRRKRVSQPKLLIIFLAAVAIVLTIFGILPRIFIFTRQPCTGYVDMYTLARLCSSCLINLSKLTVVLMAIERCISIQAPFFYVRQCTVKCFCIAELILFMYAVLKGLLWNIFNLNILNATILNLGDSREIRCSELFLQFESSMYLKWTTALWKHSNVFILAEIIEDAMLILVLLCCNTTVICGIDALEKRLKVTCPRPLGDSVNELDITAIKGREFSRLMIAISIVFIILVTPNMLRIVCNQLDFLPSHTADFICYRISFTIVFINPFLYGLLRRNLRIRAFHQLLHILKCCRPNTVAPVELSCASSHICARNAVGVHTGHGGPQPM